MEIGSCRLRGDCSGGYPGTYAKGMPIAGINAAETEGAVVFHAGTQLNQKTITTDGDECWA